MYHGVKWFKCNPKAYSYNLVAFEKLDFSTFYLSAIQSLVRVTDMADSVALPLSSDCGRYCDTETWEEKWATVLPVIMI